MVLDVQMIEIENTYQQIRGVYDDVNIRVYQAYSEKIANKALPYGTLVSPPFKLDLDLYLRMRND